MTELTFSRLTGALREAMAAFARTISDTDLDVWVPTCPEWRLRVLAVHLGQASRWAARIVREGPPESAPDPRSADLPANTATWLREGAEELIAAVDAADAPVWTFDGPGPARSWLRRIVHDTVIHRVDAALTVGADYEFPADVAADALVEGVDRLSRPSAEVLRPGLAALRGNGETIALRSTDMPGSVRVTRTPTGITWSRDDGPADVTVTGSAADLVLVFARRLPSTRLTVDGDGGLLAHWLEHSAV